MANKIILFSSIILCLISCKVNNTKETVDFNEYLLHDRIVIHTLKAGTTNKEINIFDSKNIINLNSKSLNINDTTVNIVENKENADYYLVEYVLNKDLAFLAFSKKEENKVICFLFNKGKNKGKWLLIEKFEKRSL